jgi:hypothetical protein
VALLAIAAAAVLTATTPPKLLADLDGAKRDES